MKTKDMTIGMHVEAKAGYSLREAIVVAFRSRDEAVNASWYAKQDTIGIAYTSPRADGVVGWTPRWVRPQDIIRPWAERVAEEERARAAAEARKAAEALKMTEGCNRIKAMGIKPIALAQALNIGPEESMQRRSYDYNKVKRQDLYKGRKVSIYVDLDTIQALVDLARSTEAPVPVPDDALDHFLRSLGVEV